MRIYLLIAITCAGCAKPVEPVVVEQPTFQTAPIVEHDLLAIGESLRSLSREQKDILARLDKIESRLGSVESAADEAIRPSELMYELEAAERRASHFDYRD